MPKLLITVDAEPSRYRGRPLPYEITMEGRLEGGVHGVERLMDLSEAAGGRATFFLDVLAHRVHGDRLRGTAELLAGRGHDVQVHTHPLWVGERGTMPEYDLDEQRALLEECASRIEAWTGRAPTAHRAGDLALNDDTLAALPAAGLDVDSSYAPGYPPCAALGEIFADTRPSRARGLIQIPLGAFTAFRLGSLVRHRLFDFNAVTLTEVRAFLRRARRLGLPQVTLLLHSFSLLRMNDARTSFRFDPAADERLQALLDEARGLGYELTTVSEYRRELLEAEAAEPELLAPGAEPPMPDAGAWITYLSAVERFSVSRKAKLVALAPPVFLVLLLILLIYLMRVA